MMPAAVRRLGDEAEVARLRDSQAELCRKHSSGAGLLYLSEARSKRPRLSYPCYPVAHPGVHELNIDIAESREFINWRAFLSAWKIDASLASVMDIKGCDHCRAQWLASVPSEKVNKAAEAMQLLKEAGRVLDRLQRDIVGGIKAKVAFVEAASDGGDDILFNHDGETLRIATLRQQRPSERDGHCIALSDYIAPVESDGKLRDSMGMFAVTVGRDIERIIESYKNKATTTAPFCIKPLPTDLSKRLPRSCTERSGWSCGDTLPTNRSASVTCFNSTTKAYARQSVIRHCPTSR